MTQAVLSWVIENVLSNDFVIAALIDYILSLVPGRYHGIIRTVFEYVAEHLKAQTVETAVHSTEQTLPELTGQEKYLHASKVIRARFPDMPADEMKVAIEAKVNQMNQTNAKLDALEAKLNSIPTPAQ